MTKQLKPYKKEFIKLLLKDLLKAPCLLDFQRSQSFDTSILQSLKSPLERFKMILTKIWIQQDI